MSNDKTTAAPVQNITSMSSDDTTTVSVEKKPNVAVRAFRKIKTTPPKTALAIVGGVALVAAGAVLGRNTAPLHLAVVESDLDVQPMFEYDAAESPTDTVD